MTHPAIKQSYALLFAAAHDPELSILDRMERACLDLFNDAAILNHPFRFVRAVNASLQSGELSKSHNGEIRITDQGRNNLRTLRNGFIEEPVPTPECAKEPTVDAA